MRRELRLLVDNLEKGIVKHIDARKLWKTVTRGKKPSAATLDKLALLAGFQCWDDLKASIRTGGDETFNYDNHPGK